MFDLFFGSDRENVQEAVAAKLEKHDKKGSVITRITDAHSLADLEMSLRGAGLFGDMPAVIFDGLVSGENEILATRLLSQLSMIAKSDEQFYVLEGVLDASTRKLLEKYAEKSERFDLAKKEERSTIFSLANALRSGDKKALWIGYHRELQKGSAPEAIHGVLFWAAKESFMQARSTEERERATRLVAELAELPHASRRRGFDLEYSLEHFALSVTR